MSSRDRTSRRILIVQPSVQPPGGGNGVAAWMIHGLQQAGHAVTVMTLQAFDAAAINRFYGTSIDGSRIDARLAQPRAVPLLDKARVPLALLRSSLLFRELHHLKDEWDLTITANNEADLHRRGIQYVHFPTYLRPRPSVDHRPYHFARLMDLYYAACDRIAGVSREGVMRNLSLVNSNWTGRYMRRWYDGHETTTLYPPVAGEFPEVPWEERAPHFVSLGRLAPEKDLDRTIDILGEVRKRFPEVHLHIIGTHNDEPYARHILGRIAQNQSWITLHQNLSRAALAQLVARQRFGLHAMAEEHFGMGVAEIVRGGCVIWVRNGGGQVEIVRDDARLTYDNNDQAVAKISAALADDAYARSLRDLLDPQRSRFTEEVFVEHFLRIVDDFFAQAQPGTGHERARGKTA